MKDTRRRTHTHTHTHTRIHKTHVETRTHTHTQTPGHTCTAVDAATSWGTELAVLFGGVSTAPSANAAEPVQHTALDSTCVLASGGGSWFSPNMSGRLPDARAFHAAGSLGCVPACLLAFHVLLSKVPRSTHEG
eukprot:1150416-Pelagomonas_calceolata.AAC.1